MHLMRQQLVRVSPGAWKTRLAERADLSGEPLLQEWAVRGWPLIVRRPLPNEEGGLPVGIPLPPSAGKRRIAVQLQPEDLASVAPLPELRDAIDTAPSSWRPTLWKLTGLADGYCVVGRVFGSLAWQLLTGLTYLGPKSDLDIILSLPRRDQLEPLLADLAEIDSCAPMRVDGELVREDGATANWRELRRGCAEVVVKTRTALELCSVAAFLGTRDARNCVRQLT
jgi:phosphoribosyl-dephospho-CoA transferase